MEVFKNVTGLIKPTFLKKKKQKNEKTQIEKLWGKKKQLQWDIISYQSEWLSSKSPQTINAREGVERREAFYIVGGNVNWYSHYGKQCEVSLKN